MILGHGTLLLEYYNMSFINHECVIQLHTMKWQEERSVKYKGKYIFLLLHLRNCIHTFWNFYKHSQQAIDLFLDCCVLFKGTY